MCVCACVGVFVCVIVFMCVCDKCLRAYVRVYNGLCLCVGVCAIRVPYFDYIYLIMFL